MEPPSMSIRNLSLSSSQPSTDGLPGKANLMSKRHLIEQALSSL